MRQFQTPHFNTNGQKNIRFQIAQFMGGTKGADPGTHFQSLFRAQKLTQPSGTHQKWGWVLSSIFCIERQGPALDYI